MLKYIAEDEQEYPELVIYVGLCKESKINLLACHPRDAFLLT
jgi:hypothetical protein